MADNKVYSIEEIRDKIKSQEEFLREKFYVGRFLLFGSYASGNPTSSSDIDLLVEFNAAVDMFLLVDLQEYLTNLFGKTIDLGTPNALKDFIKKTILKDAIAI